MAGQDLDTLQARSKIAWAMKDNWKGLLSECYEFALPVRNPYTQTDKNSQGQDKSSSRVFDSSLQVSASKLANRLQYDLFPMGQEWADLVPGAFVPAGAKAAAREELKFYQSLIFAAIQLSNFDLSIGEWLLELVVAGTAVMVVTTGGDLNPIVFRCVSQAHVAFLEGAIGSIDFITINHKMRLDQISAQWEDAKNIPEPSNEDKGKQEEIKLAEISYYDYDAATWRYEVIYFGDSKKRVGSKIVERTYKVQPIIVSRWSKAVDEVQGRSLVMDALPDARVLSAVKNYILKQAALSILGVFLVKNDGGVNPNTARIYPGAMIPVRTTGGSSGASIEPLQVGGDVNLAQLVVGDLQESINKIMLNTGIPDIGDGVRTATEYLERLKDMQQSIGAPFSRILREGIVPMLEGTMQILVQAGHIPATEDGSVIRLNGGDIDLKFTSPLVQSQATREVEKLVNAITVIMQVSGERAAELVPLTTKIEDIPAWVYDKLKVDPSLVRSKEEVDEMQRQGAEMMAQQQGAAPAPDAGMEAQGQAQADLMG